MPLRSFLFKNDPRLEACLHKNAAHVRLGAHGEHVAKIQAAIYIAAGLNIAPRELATATYGLSTAEAVLKYKTDRQIINHSYQQKPDDIVGKMTIAALDAEARPEITPQITVQPAKPRRVRIQPTFVHEDFGQRRPWRNDGHGFFKSIFENVWGDRLN